MGEASCRYRTVYGGENLWRKIQRCTRREIVEHFWKACTLRARVREFFNIKNLLDG
jgi:hypothetical protein